MGACAQIDLHDLLLPKFRTTKKLVCPGCEQATLEGGGHCTKLRTVHSLQELYLYYNRFRCPNCPSTTAWASQQLEDDEEDADDAGVAPAACEILSSVVVTL